MVAHAFPYFSRASASALSSASDHSPLLMEGSVCVCLCFFCGRGGLG
jgi:hypothetical protein